MVVEPEAVLERGLLATADDGVVVGEEGVVVDEVLEVARVVVVVVELGGMTDEGIGLVVVEVVEVDEIAVGMLDEEDEDKVAIGALLEILKGVPLSG